MIIKPDGPIESRIYVCGERPGYEEYRAAERSHDERNFVGPAGQELWSVLSRIAKIDRGECRVGNLVPTFSTDPPTLKEIQYYDHLLVRDLRRVRPTLIITVGYHAARWFLPQYEHTNGDFFHGLPHTTPKCPGAILVPCVHSSAALRQPGKFQQQLVSDIEAVARVLRHGSDAVRDFTPLQIYQSGLAVLGGVPKITGFDTEFDSESGEVQAITLSHGRKLHTMYEGVICEPDNAIVYPLLANMPLVAHAASAEYASLARLGIDRLTPLDDTMIMAFVLARPHLGLKALMKRELGILMPSYEDIVNPVDDQRMTEYLTQLHARLAKRGLWEKKRGSMPEGVKRARRACTSIAKMIATPDPERTVRKRWQASVFSERYNAPPAATWKDAPKQTREPYAMGDAVGARLLHDHLLPELKEKGLLRAYKIQRDVLPWLARNEHIGLAVDAKRLKELSQAFAAAFRLTCSTINELAGKTVNPLSGEQVSDCLFHELGVRPTRLTKSQKIYTTADKYLKARRKEHEIIQHILDARQLNKYKSTYTDKLPDMLREGRYHPDWNYCGTASARLAEQVILLIPKHDPMAKAQQRENRAQAIRDCFYAIDGNDLVSVDLSQIELRVMADRSGDEKMLKVFERNEDMHADTAWHLLGAPKGKENQDESAHRLPAKTMNFGIINGMTEYGMLDQLHEAGQLQWDIEQVREFRQGWFRVYVGVKDYWERKIHEAKAKGYIVTMFGRRRYLAGVRSTSEQVRLETERQCLGEIQSAADDISKLWNIRIWNRIIRELQRDRIYCEPWIRVHDDTTLEVSVTHARAVADRMLALVPDLLSIPTLAEAKHGQRWGSIEKFKKAS